MQAIYLIASGVVNEYGSILSMVAWNPFFLRTGVLAAVLCSDRLTKLWAMRRLAPRLFIPVFPFFRLTYVENTGAAFGIGHSRNAFFIVLTVVLLSGLTFLRRRWPRQGWLEAGFLLVVGGALGNLYDRLAYGFVVDFLDFRVWPVFNVADSCITVGACCLAWGLSRLDKKAAAL